MDRDEAFRRARAVERGEAASGDVILALTGPRSLTTPSGSDPARRGGVVPPDEVTVGHITLSMTPDRRMMATCNYPGCGGSTDVGETFALDGGESVLSAWLGEHQHHQTGEAVTAAEWNDRHPIGTPVYAAPGLLRAEGGAVFRTRTRSRAWELGDGTPVVAVEGFPGGIRLDHITVRSGGSR